MKNWKKSINFNVIRKSYFDSNRNQTQTFNCLPLSIVGVNTGVVMTDDGLLFRIRCVSFGSKRNSCVSVSSCNVVDIEMACCVVSGRLDGRLYSRCPIVVCSLSSYGNRVDFSAEGRTR